MKRLMLGLLVGLGVGAAVPIGAQRQPEPCAHAWILWTHGWDYTGMKSLDAWDPADAFTAKTECDALARPANEKNLKASTGAKGFTVTCYPDTFDPRGKQ